MELAKEGVDHGVGDWSRCARVLAGGSLLLPEAVENNVASLVSRLSQLVLEYLRDAAFPS